jgi:hypothetical protein
MNFMNENQHLSNENQNFSNAGQAVPDSWSVFLVMFERSVF